MSSDWMQHAVPPSHKGKFTEKAKAAGFTSDEAFAQHVMANQSKYDSTTIHEAELAMTFAKESRDRASKLHNMYPHPSSGAPAPK